ncbi:MAG: YIP1 family protein [Rhodobacteraceae bacterium]|nr:YIP1 family protein [Paracoccaceae bacterium]
MPVSTDILRSYRAPRAVLRGLQQGQRREARILVYLLVACGLVYVAQWPRLARQAHFDDSVPLEALMSGALFGVMFLAPLIFYAIGGVMGLVLRAFVRGIDGFDVRLALFWALLVVSPLMLLQGLVSGLIGPGREAMLSGALVFVVFAAVLIAGLRVALEAARGRA